MPSLGSLKLEYAKKSCGETSFILVGRGTLLKTANSQDTPYSDLIREVWTGSTYQPSI